MKKLLLVFTCLLGVAQGWASPVTAEQARQKASRFVNNRIAAHARAAVKSLSNVEGNVQTQLKMASVGDEQSYYIFNVGQNEGYVVVSGDDATDEILGYCDSGSIDPDQMPCNMRAWMDGYAKQIKFIRQKGVKKAETAITFTGHYELEGRLAKWGQQEPFFNYCPKYNGASCVTGCAATAMAQIMYYHQWPQKPVRDIPEYVSKRHKLTVTSVSAEARIPWEYIEADYRNLGDMTEQQKNAVAVLMKDAGTSVHMDYDPIESLIPILQVAYALPHYFGYDPRTEAVAKANYTDENKWLQLIYDELQRGPVFYRADDKEHVNDDGTIGGGHAFLVEGIDGDMLKINWGWNGSSGYHEGAPEAPWFKSSLLNCKTPGGDFYTFKHDHAILTHVEPNRSGSYPEMPLYLFCEYIYPADGNMGPYTRNQGIRLNVRFWNPTPVATAFDYGVGLYDMEGNLVGNIVTLGSTPLIEGDEKYPANENEEDPGPTIDVKLPIDADAPNGKYNIRLLSKAAGSDSYLTSDPRWVLRTIEITLDGNKVILGHVDTEETVNLEVTSLEINNADMAGKTFTGTTLSGHFLLQNNNYKTNRDHVYVFVVEEGDTQKLNPDMDPIYCDLLVHPHQTQTIFFNFENLEEGHRYAIAVADFEMKEFYRSDYFTCLPESSGNLNVGQTFTAKTVENVTVRYKVVSKLPKQVIVEPVKNGEMDYDAAIDKNTVGNITIPAEVNGWTVVGIGNNAFYNCKKITEVNLPLTVKTIGRCAFFFCSALEHITGLDGITAIEEVAFKGCEKMKAFNLPHTLKRIGSQTFADCTGLTAFILPSSVTLLEAGDLFMGCENLKTIVVEKGNPVYDSRGDCNAFIRTADNTLIGGCAGTVIPFGVTAIEKGALNSTPGLEKLELPPSLTDIGDYSLMYCLDLRGIIAHSPTPLPIKENAFNGYSYDPDVVYNNATLYVPKGSKQLYQAAEGWGRFANIKELAEKVRLARLEYNGWTYDLNKQYASANGSRRQTEAQEADVRTDADGWPMYRAALTLDATDKDGQTTTHTVDDGGLFLDMSQLGTYQRPTLMFDQNTKVLRIFTNSKSEGNNYNMDGYVYTSSLQDINFQKETVFEGQNWGWYAHFAQAEDGSVQIAHYDMDEYTVVTSTENGEGAYDNVAGEEIVLPTEAQEANGETEQTLVIEAGPAADVDMNKVIDLNDMLRVMGAISGESVPNADVNGDGRVDIADIMAIAQSIVREQYLAKVEAIDLGLPSGTLWASCNLGATAPEEFGNLYAWAELAPKEAYEEKNYALNAFDTETDNYVYTDLTDNGDISGMPEYDAATATLGTPWRMPTYSEISELKSNCEAEWTSINGIKGVNLVGPNGNKIFLPATQYDNESGWYWSSRQYTGDSNPWALALYIDTDRQGVYTSGYFRYLGFNIRPVRK